MALQFWIGRRGFPYQGYGLVRLIWVFCAALGALAVFWFATRTRPVEFASIARPSLSGGIIALLLLVNSAGPYLGFRSTLAFSMFSNLRVEGESNHWLVPKGAVQIFSEGDDLVTILWSDLPSIQSLGLGRWEIPRLEFARILESGRKFHSSFSVFTRYQGRAGWVTPNDPGPFRLSNYPYWKAKFFSYRAVPPSGVNRCIW
ncbi:MAG: hypothetical protein ACXVCK_18470, partial [Bdellovibrionota bacterium]